MSYQYDYEEQIKKDYEFIGLKILDLSCLIEIIPIKYIDQGKFIYDYDYKYLIPLEITSLNVINDSYREFLKNFLKMNNIIDIENIELDKILLEKEKEIFLYDDSGKKNKNIDIKEKNKNKMKIKEKKDKKRKKPKGPSIEREIINFKFKNLDDYYL